MPKCIEEGFNIVDFFKVGMFQQEDTLYLDQIANGTEMAAHFSAEDCKNFLGEKGKGAENSWISDFAMDSFIRLLISKYPDVKFITTSIWKGRNQYFHREIKEELHGRKRSYYAVLVCSQQHWFWVVYDASPTVNTIYYGDNLNIESGVEGDIMNMLGQFSLLFGQIMSDGAVELPAIKIQKLKSPDFSDGINCGTFAACTLMMFLESGCDPKLFENFVNLNLCSLNKIEFLRYKLAMCIALQSLTVKVSLFKEAADSEVSIDHFNLLNLPLDYPNTLEIFVPNALSEVPLVFQEEPLILLDEPASIWPSCVVFSDLQPPAGVDDHYSVLLYLIASHSGISLVELHKAAEQRGIPKFNVNEFVNYKVRMTDNYEKIPPACRLVKHQNENYYATETMVAYFMSNKWSFSRFDEIKLKKKKVPRRLPPRKQNLMLEDGRKLKRAYQSMKMKESWGQFIRRLTQDYSRPLSTSDMKMVCKLRKYYEDTLGKLEEQKFTLRLIQGMDIPKNSNIEGQKAQAKGKRGRAKRGAKKKRDNFDTDSKSCILTLPSDICHAISHESMMEVVCSMSNGIRIACHDFIDLTLSREKILIGREFTEVDDRGMVKKLLNHCNTNKQDMESYINNLSTLLRRAEVKILFVEFLIRAAIEKVLECYDHLRRLLFLDSNIKIKLVADCHIITARKHTPVARAPKENQKTEPPDVCSIFLIPLRFMLYANQTSKFESKNVDWCEINPNDAVEKKLVCRSKHVHNLFQSLNSEYWTLTEPLYYGTLLEMPDTADYQNWLTENFRKPHHDDPPRHLRYVTIAGVRYLECLENFKTGDNFYVDI